ncbi:MAG: NrfD/PsrC family molybdoenzyme membrane anchor subunit [Thermomicrobiales bacterium]
MDAANAKIEDSTENPALPGYYGVPVIHGSHWKWLIIWYFFFGGMSGASAVIAALSRLAGGPSNATLTRTATYVSFAALVPCPALLILDLGRPRRFLNMVRVFRPSSPMSLGSWGLAAFGLVSTLATAYQASIDLSIRSGKHAKGHRHIEQSLALVSATTGFFLAGYTGVLLAATAVPLWSKRPGLLGPLFLSSAMTSGAAAVTVATAVGGAEDRRLDALHRLEAMSTIAEGALLTCWLVRLGSTGKPVTEGRLDAVVRHGVVGAGMVIPLAMTAIAQWTPARHRRTLTTVASLLTLLGVFALRYSVVEGGRRSADDPQATFDLTG